MQEMNFSSSLSTCLKMPDPACKMIVVILIVIATIRSIVFCVGS